jgi:hypothetical protein
LTETVKEKVEFIIRPEETGYYRVIINNEIKREGVVPYPNT